MALVLATVTCHTTGRTLPVFAIFMFMNAVCLFAMASFQTCNGKEEEDGRGPTGGGGGGGGDGGGDWSPCQGRNFTTEPNSQNKKNSPIHVCDL